MKRVLFICVRNASRSQMAEAFFNHMAGGKALAISAGTKPAEQMNPVVVEAMREAGIDTSKKKPKLLTIDMFDGTDRAITMGCGEEGVCPAGFFNTEDWALDDPRGQTLEKVRQIRDEIKTRVEKLVKELSG